MFQFFKKSGQRERPRSSSKLQILVKPSPNAYRRDSGPPYRVSANINDSRVWGCDNCLEEEEEDDTCGDVSGSQITTIRSRLSKTLPEILSDKGALGYFFQFLEARRSVDLIKFWLEVECLCGSYAVIDEAGDRTRDDSSSVSADDNDNYRCDIAGRNATAEHSDGEKLSEESLVNNKEKESNNKESGETGSIEKGAEKSKIRLITGSREVAAAKQDALRIYKRYLVRETLGPGLVPEELRNEAESYLVSEDVRPALECLRRIQGIVYKALEDEHMDEFLKSDFHCKHQIDVLTSGDVQLADILYNETAFFHFIEFMEIEGKRELLDFWMSAVHYKQNLLRKGDSADPTEAQTDALILYDKYFSLQATMPLGFSNKIRFQLEENICREDGDGPKPDCFDRPCQIVYKFLDKHYLAAFLSSQLYYKYLSELISTIQSSPCPGLHPRLKRAGSDCSSEVSTVSVGTQSGVQVGGGGCGEQSRRGKSNENGSMSIDTRQLYDPDSLWKRQKYNLSVGYVNDMGRFVTEIDPDPHRRHESRFSRAVKRFVNMDNDKVKEEMAWKIAEMIVREITSLTLGVSHTHLS